MMKKRGRRWRKESKFCRFPPNTTIHKEILEKRNHLLLLLPMELFAAENTTPFPLFQLSSSIIASPHISCILLAAIRMSEEEKACRKRIALGEWGSYIAVGKRWIDSDGGGGDGEALNITFSCFRRD